MSWRNLLLAFVAVALFSTAAVAQSPCQGQVLYMQPVTWQQPVYYQPYYPQVIYYQPQPGYYQQPSYYQPYYPAYRCVRVY